VLLAAAGCFTVARTREREVIETEGRTATLAVLIDAPGVFGLGPAALLFWPVETVVDVGLAVRAPFDPDLDIQWGPLGALGAIVLPGLTVLPYIYRPPLGWPRNGPPANVPPATFDALLARVRAGDGVAAYHELLGDAGGLSRYTIHDVQLVPDPGPPKPGAAHR
jgi:hypothetical protein